MKTPSFFQRIAQLLLVVALFGGGFAMAQNDPTIEQIYTAAQAGKLDQAQTMIQQVLIAHPKSARAYFVRAELYSRQGNYQQAREALATADQLAPKGIPFTKPEAVQELRTQLSRHSQASNNAMNSDRSSGSNTMPAMRPAPPPPAPQSSSWGMPLLLAGLVIVGGYFLFRRRDPAPQQGTYGGQNTLSGPQNFGGGGGGYPQYPQGGGYPQAGGTGLGGRIVGGVATGLAVGAGVLAAEAIGRNLMGNHNANASQTDNNYGSSSNNDYQPINDNSNQDMGGANFGSTGSDSWDSGGSSDSGSGGGGGDWDN